MKNYIITEELMNEIMETLDKHWLSGTREYNNHDIINLSYKLKELKEEEINKNNASCLSDAEQHALDYFLSIKVFEIPSDPKLYKMGREIMKNKLT